MALNIPNVPRLQVGGKSRVLWIAGAGILVLLLGYNSCTTYVRPGQAGVKQIKFGLNKGIEQAVYGTGLHYIGGGATVHRFPMRVQVLELSSSRRESSDDPQGPPLPPALTLQT